MDGREATTISLLGVVALAGVPVMALGPELFPAYKALFFWGGVAIIALALIALVIVNLRRRLPQTLTAEAEKAPVKEATSGSPPPGSREATTLYVPRDDPNAKGKVFLGENITPRFLMGLYEEKTNLQGAAQAKAYLGKWIRLSGEVRNTGSGLSGDWVAFAPPAPGIAWDWMSTTVIIVYFRKRQKGIDTLHVGNKIVAQGQIALLERGSIRLESGELLEP